MAVDDLKNGSELEDNRSSDQGPPTSETSGDRPDEEATKEGTCLEYANGIRVHGRGLSVRVLKVSLKGL